MDFGGHFEFRPYWEFAPILNFPPSRIFYTDMYVSHINLQIFVRGNCIRGSMAGPGLMSACKDIVFKRPFIMCESNQSHRCMT